MFIQIWRCQNNVKEQYVQFENWRYQTFLRGEECKRLKNRNINRHFVLVLFEFWKRGCLVKKGNKLTVRIGWKKCKVNLSCCEKILPKSRSRRRRGLWGSNNRAWPPRKCILACSLELFNDGLSQIYLINVRAFSWLFVNQETKKSRNEIAKRYVYPTFVFEK